MPNLQSSTTVLSTSKPLRVVDIVDGTSVDGPGLRTSIYFAGCAHRCPGCHNPSTWPADAGRNMTVEELLHHVDVNDFNVTLTGGDPVYQAEALLPLVEGLKARGKSVWCYTGFTLEELLEEPRAGVKELLGMIDVLVDGPYVEALRDTSLRFRGSANQRLLNMPATLAASAPVLYGE